MGSGPNDRGASRKHIEDSVAASLRKLQTSYIGQLLRTLHTSHSRSTPVARCDAHQTVRPVRPASGCVWPSIPADLYQVHTWMEDTPLTEQMFALDSLVRRGLVRYLGCSNFTSWQLNEANRIVKEHHLTPFVVIQQQYSLLCRTIEWDTIDVLQKDSVGILPWSPLAGGWLSGRYKRGSKQGEGGSRVEWAEAAGWRATDFSSNANEHAYRIIDALDAISKEVNQPIAAIALRWLLQRAHVSSVLIGARSVQQLHDNLRASTFTLSEQHMKRLTDASHTPLPYPFSLQKGQMMLKQE